MFKIQYRPTGTPGDEGWNDDSAQYLTEAEAARYAHRMKIMADIETRIVEAE